MASQGSLISARAWGDDEPRPDRIRRVARAAGIAGLWTVSAVPAALGWQRCPVAAIWHRPCPGCGMTRALKLFASGEWGASLRMHPLAIPFALSAGLLALSTVWVTARDGSPFDLHRTRLGRIAIGLAIVSYAMAFVLWLLRASGFWGGPVPV